MSLASALEREYGVALNDEQRQASPILPIFLAV